MEIDIIAILGITCRKFNGLPSTQPMAALPSDRVSGDEPPFTNTGTDLLGSFEVTNGRKREKRMELFSAALVVVL